MPKRSVASQEELAAEAEALRNQLQQIDRERAQIHRSVLTARSPAPAPEKEAAIDPYANPVAGGSGTQRPPVAQVVPNSPVHVSEVVSDEESDLREFEAVERLYEFDEGDPEEESAENVVLARVDVVGDPLELPTEVEQLVDAERNSCYAAQFMLPV